MQIVFWICIVFVLCYFQAILAKHSVNKEESVGKIYGLCGAPPPIKPKEVRFVKGPSSRFKAGEPEFVNMKFMVEYKQNVEWLGMAQKEQLKRSVTQSVEFYEKLLKIRSADRAEKPEEMNDRDNEEFMKIMKRLVSVGADFNLEVDYGCEIACAKSCEGTDFTIAWAMFTAVKNASLSDGTFQPWHFRPVRGKCYICQGQISGKPKDDQKILATIKHEILHALGFGQDFIEKRLEEREINWKVTEERSWKKKVAYYTGPHTRDAARAHFGCPDLDGAEVEDFGGSVTRHHHWDKRAFGPELMTGSISQKSYFSNITAAFLRDLGWYEVDDSMIDHEAYWYGKNKTCEFAMKSCRSYIDYAEKDVALQKLHAPAIPYCSEKRIQAWHSREKYRLWDEHAHLPRTCSSDRSTYMECGLAYPYTALTTEGNGGWNKSHYGYFSDKGSSLFSKVHGNSKMLDFCPVFMDIYTEDIYTEDALKRGYSSVCSNGYNNQAQPDQNLGAMLFGDSSLCFEQGQYFVRVNCETWMPLRYDLEDERKYAGAGCYDHKCSNGRLMIRTFAAEDTEEVDLFEICKAPGEEILIQRRISVVISVICVRGTIVCPKCEDICEGKNNGFKCGEGVHETKPVGKTTPNPVEKISPTSSGSGIFPSLVISMMVILVRKRSSL